MAFFHIRAYTHPVSYTHLSESVPSAPEEPSESSGESPLTDDEISELIREGIVPEDAAQKSSGAAVYDERKVQDSIEKYRERVECCLLYTSRCV